MAQQNIDFGTFPDDPDADAIRTAFSKVQNNFDELFSTITAGSVTSVNGGAGIAVNTPTGNVIITANLAQVTVTTSSLSIGRGSNGGTSANITSSAQTLVIDINPANVFSGNFSGVSSALANLNGTLTLNSNSQPNITSLGTLISLAVTGNITAGNIYANSGNVGAARLSGSLTTAAQGNITSVGTLTGLNVNGTVTASAFTANTGMFSGDGGGLSNISTSAGSYIVSGSSNVKVEINSNVNVTVAGVANIVTFTSTGTNVNGYLTVVGNVTSGNANLGNAATANYFIGNLYGHANTSGTVTIASQPNITSVGTLTNLTVTGNIVSGNVYANSGIIKAQYLSGDGSNITNLSAGIILVNGNSNVNIPNANGNINISAVGNANIVVVTGTGVNVTGTINATGTISGNFSGNVITASQGNITSLGTLTGLNVNGVANLGAVGNVRITGSAGFLQSDGSGNLTFSSPIVQIIPGAANTILLSSGSNTIISSGNIKFNDPQLDITGTLSVTGNANVGNLSATSLTGTLTTASNQQSNIKLVGTLDYLIINTNGYLSMGSGNITAGNISLIAAGSANLGNSATANYFIGNLQGNVALANVIGAGNIASINLNGNSSQILYGNGVFATAAVNYGNSNVATFLASYGSNTISTTGNITAGNMLASNFVGVGSGTPTITSVTNLDLSPAIAVRVIGGGILTVAGNITASRLISNIATGTAPFVVTSTTQVANLNVATAGLATFATTANAVAGANVIGAVAFATTSVTANSVAGANVSGTVANATYATSAGSVTNAVTFNNGGAGDVSGTTFNGGAARTVSYNSVGAPSTTGTNASGTWGINVTGSAGSATTAGTVTTAAQPNITSVGTLTSLTTTSITTGASGTSGTITGNWSLSAGSQLRATYADLAEYYAGEVNIEPGTVVEFGGAHEVQICNSYMSTLVAGIVTTNPAYIMNDGIECEYPVAIALQGRVPTKVIGPVKRGDMMVSTNDGYAISCKSPTMGTVLGKALTDFNGEIGMIEIMVGRT